MEVLHVLHKFNKSGAMKGAVAFIALFVTLRVVAQGQYASAADLRAAFCVEPLKVRLNILAQGRAEASAGKSTWSPEFESDYQDLLFRHNKLSRYVASRLPSFGQGALLEYASAYAAGKDAVQHARAIGDACLARYSISGVVPLSSLADFGKCAKEMGLGSLRLEQCDDISFLPY